MPVDLLPVCRPLSPAKIETLRPVVEHEGAEHRAHVQRKMELTSAKALAVALEAQNKELQEQLEQQQEEFEQLTASAATVAATIAELKMQRDAAVHEHNAASAEWRERVSEATAAAKAEAAGAAAVAREPAAKAQELPVAMEAKGEATFDEVHPRSSNGLRAVEHREAGVANERIEVGVDSTCAFAGPVAGVAAGAAGALGGSHATSPIVSPSGGKMLLAALAAHSETMSATPSSDELTLELETLFTSIRKHKQLTQALHKPLLAYRERMYEQGKRLEIVFIAMLTYSVLTLDETSAVDDLANLLDSNVSLVHTAKTALAAAATYIQSAARGCIARAILKRKSHTTGSVPALVFGSLNMDLKATHRGTSTSDVLESNSNSFLGDFSALPGGKGLNQAVACARLGVTTHLIGCVGNDGLATTIKDFLHTVTREGCLSIKHVGHADEDAEAQATGVAVQIIGQHTGKKVTVCCLGANMSVSDREVDAAIKLLHGPSAVKMLVMQLEVDMGSMRKLANDARRAGIFVALKLSPLDSINAPQVKDFLRDGSVHMAYLTTTEASVLLGLKLSIITVKDAEEVSEELLNTFPGLTICIVRAELGVVLRARTRARAPPRRGRVSHPTEVASPTHRHEDRVLRMPHRYLTQSPSIKRDVIGAGDAFFAGFAAGWCHRLTTTQSMLWAYGAGQLCALEPGGQLGGDRDELLTVLRYELGDVADQVMQLRPGDLPSMDTSMDASSTVPAFDRADDGRIPAPGAHDVLSDANFLHQNVLHIAVMRGSISYIPPIGSKELPLAELRAMLAQKDALGYTPLQRAHECRHCMRIALRNSQTRQTVQMSRVYQFMMLAQLVFAALDTEDESSVPESDEMEPTKPSTSMSDEMGAELTGAAAWMLCASKPISFHELVVEEVASSHEPWLSATDPLHKLAANAVLAALTRLAAEIRQKVAARREELPTASFVSRSSERPIANDSVGYRDPYASVFNEEQTGLWAMTHTKSTFNSAYLDMEVYELGLLRGVLPPLLEKQVVDASGVSIKQVAMAMAEKEGDASGVSKSKSATGMRTSSLGAVMGEPAQAQQTSTFSRDFARSLLTLRSQLAGWSLMMFSAATGLKEIVDVLIRLGEHSPQHDQRSACSFRGATPMHAAASAHDYEICEMLLKRTRLQLIGPAATTADGLTPIDAALDPEFGARLHKLRGSYSYIAFLSHYKDEAASEARIFKEGIERVYKERACDSELTQRDPKVFLDSDNLKTLSELRDNVTLSDVLVVILTPGVLSRPWCLIEMLTALDAGKPLISINISGRPSGSYNYEQMVAFLENLPAELERVNPGAIKVLAENGYPSIRRAGHDLACYLHNPISVPYNVAWSRNMLDATLKDMVEKLESAKPPEFTSRRMIAERKLAYWVTSYRMRKARRLP